MINNDYLAVAPNGFQYDWDETIWNVGFVFKWSKFYNEWIMTYQRVSVPPKTSLAEVMLKHNIPLFGEYDIFFAIEKE